MRGSNKVRGPAKLQAQRTSYDFAVFFALRAGQGRGPEPVLVTELGRVGRPAGLGNKSAVAGTSRQEGISRRTREESKIFAIESSRGIQLTPTFGRASGF